MPQKQFNAAASGYEQSLLDSGLMDAVRRGSALHVELALSRGANPNATDGNGMTALVSAAISRNPDHIRMLTEAGADPDARYLSDPREPTALMLLAEVGAAKAVKALLEGGADPDLQDKNGDTALMYTAEFGHMGTIEALLDGGANIYVLNSKCESACDLLSKKGFKFEEAGETFDTAKAARRVDDCGNPVLKKDIVVGRPLRFKLA